MFLSSACLHSVERQAGEKHYTTPPRDDAGSKQDRHRASPQLPTSLVAGQVDCRVCEWAEGHHVSPFLFWLGVVMRYS
jgi:hypothetical protein